MAPNDTVAFEAVDGLETEGSTVLVGLPGLGLVGVIAVGHLTDQLGLSYRGRLASEQFPHVATYAEGRYRDPVRVYADDETRTTAVQADLVFPPRAHEAISTGVVDHLAEGCDQLLLPVGAPAETVDDRGDVTAITTTEALEADLRAGGVPLAPGVGSIGGPTGALLSTCARQDVPAIALIVRVEPYNPDLSAASALLTDGVEVLVDFEVDTTPLERREAELAAEMEQMARRVQQTEARIGLEEVPPEREPSMFQ